MANISEHNTEKEGECNTSENCWINFFVGRHTISVHDLLEYSCELVHSEQAWRSYAMIFY